jgi:hypothetical protein
VQNNSVVNTIIKIANLTKKVHGAAEPMPYLYTILILILRQLFYVEHAGPTQPHPPLSVVGGTHSHKVVAIVGLTHSKCNRMMLPKTAMRGEVVCLTWKWAVAWSLREIGLRWGRAVREGPDR